MRGHLRYRSGAWRLTADAGQHPNGRRRQVHRTVHAPNTRAGRKIADAELARLILQVDAGRTVSRSMTVAEYLEGWIARRSPDWAPSTQATHPGLARRHIVPHLGGMALGELRRRDVADLHHALITGGLAASSVGKVHRILHRALADAVDLELLETNPAAGVRPPKAARTEVRPPTDDELDRIIAATKDPQLLTMLRVAAIVGARRGEIAALRWTDLDLEVGEVKVTRAISVGPDGPIEWTTKTGNRHPVAIDAETAAQLRSHRTRRREQCLAAGLPMMEDGFVFVDPRHPAGDRPIRPDGITSRFGRARGKAKVTGVRFHDLRHYVASMLLASGVDVRTVSHRLGHSSANQTLNVYGHLIPAADRDAAEILARRRAR